MTTSRTDDSSLQSIHREKKLGSLKLEINLINGDLVGLMKRRECVQLTSTQEIMVMERFHDKKPEIPK